MNCEACGAKLKRRGIDFVCPDCGYVKLRSDLEIQDLKYNAYGLIILCLLMVFVHLIWLLNRLEYGDENLSLVLTFATALLQLYTARYFEKLYILPNLLRVSGIATLCILGIVGLVLSFREILV